MRASPVPLLQGPRVSFETESSASHAHPLTRTVMDRLRATGRPRGVWPALAARLDPAAPACPASALLTGRCVRSVLGHAAPRRCCWKLSLPHTHYGLDYRAIIPPSSCVIRRSRAFTLLMASADPRLRRARKAANRPEPALRVPCWRCAEGWGCA